MPEFAKSYSWPEYKHATVKKGSDKADFSTTGAKQNSYGTPAKPRSAPRTNISGPNEGGSSKNFEVKPGFERKVRMPGTSNPESEDAMPQKGRSM